MSEKPHKLYIGGTGRAGTTFLTLILSLLGVDPGSDGERALAQVPRGGSGFEVGEFTPEEMVPYMIKGPGYISKIDSIVRKHHIDYFIIPIRDYKTAAKSREKVGRGVPGGLWGASNSEEQELFYHKIIAEYLYKMTLYDIPTIFINFEKMISNDKYLFSKLEPVLKDRSYEEFKVAYDKATKHQTFGKNTDEKK